MTVQKVSILDRPLGALIASLLLALVHQYLFFNDMPGVSYPIFVSLFYLFMYYFARDQMRNMSGFGWLLLAAIMMLSMTYLWFDNPFFYVLNLFAIPSLIFLHITFMLSSRKFDWAKWSIIADALDHLIAQSLRHIPTVFRITTDSATKKMTHRHKHVLSRVLIGLAIAAPLLLIVLNLLASADGIFNQMLSGIPAWISQVSFGEGILRLIWVVVFAFLFFGYLWGFVEPKKYEWEEDTEENRLGRRPKTSISIDPIIIATVLIAINVVYVLFVFVQFSYLFGVLQGVLPDGKSYAEYARSGFFELLAVTALNFILMIGALSWGGKGSGALRTWNRVMLYILVGCSGVMLVSSYMRLALYEDVYGYTYIRFLVHAFMIYLGILLVVAGIRIRVISIPLAKYYVVISIIAYVVINYAGMDRIIAEKNIERFRESGKIDVDYLQELSTDATPLLIRFSKEEYPDLRRRMYDNWTQLVEHDRDWPSFNLSEYRAKRALVHFFTEK